MKNVKTFVSDGISINEAKTSILVISFVVVAIFGLVMYAMRSDVTDNYVVLFQTLAVSIAGVNVANAISNSINKGE